jgi:hypothetical protein
MYDTILLQRVRCKRELRVISDEVPTGVWGSATAQSSVANQVPHLVVPVHFVICTSELSTLESETEFNRYVSMRNAVECGAHHGFER